ncbi:hypothetical protein OROMI_030754 [Orobanche minor]
MAQALATPPVLPSLSLISNRISNPPKTSLTFRLCSTLPKIGGLSIRCARVGGVEIPNSKRVEYSLQHIHGIGRTSARQILNDLNFENKLTKDFSEEELTILRKEVSKYMTEGDLRGGLMHSQLEDLRRYGAIEGLGTLWDCLVEASGLRITAGL